MAWYSKVGKVLGAVFLGHSDKDRTLAEDSVRGVGKWIDELKLTEEERIQYNASLAAEYSKYLESTLSESTARSRSRRGIAIGIMRVELSFLIFSAAIFPYNQPWAEYTFKLATGFPLGILTLSVGSFYFGSHLLRIYKSKENTK